MISSQIFGLVVIGVYLVMLILIIIRYFKNPKFDLEFNVGIGGGGTTYHQSNGRNDYSRPISSASGGCFHNNVTHLSFILTHFLNNLTLITIASYSVDHINHNCEESALEWDCNPIFPILGLSFMILDTILTFCSVLNVLSTMLPHAFMIIFAGLNISSSIFLTINVCVLLLVVMEMMVYCLVSSSKTKYTTSFSTSHNYQTGYRTSYSTFSSSSGSTSSYWDNISNRTTTIFNK
jgi:hypothetical protein